jgi:hypothetical protein
VFDDGHGPALYVAGDFATAGGLPSTRIAKWDGANWSSLNGGVDGEVICMAVWDDGTGAKLYVSGGMTTAGGVSVSRIAVWDGSTWSPFPIPPLSGCYAMLPFDDGRGQALFTGCNALAGGVQTHYVARWDGTRWSELGGGLTGAPLHCMAAYDDGSGHGPDLYFGGEFNKAGGGIPSNKFARWIRCPGPVDSICPGDMTLDVCPCSNFGQLGHGCDNSAATGGALMTSYGTTSPDTLRFVSSGELSNSLSILLQGDAPTLAVAAFGDGLRCASGHLLRLYVTNASSGTANVPGQGNPPISVQSAALGDPLGPGSVRLYQV